MDPLTGTLFQNPECPSRLTRIGAPSSYIWLMSDCWVDPGTDSVWIRDYFLRVVTFLTIYC